MVSDPLLLVGALLLVLVLAFLGRRLAGRGVSAPLQDTGGAGTVDSGTEQEAGTSVEGTPSPFLPAPDGAADDLGRIKGIGPKIAARLAELGVFHYRQIAGWTPAQLALVDRQLGKFEGRPARDRWQEQARLLAAGDLKAFERAHGKLEARRPAASSAPPRPTSGEGA